MSYAELIQPALWAAAGVISASFAVRALLARKHKAPVKQPLIASLATIGAAFLIVPAFGVVPAGHRGVVYDWAGGVDRSERGEGVTLLVPWIQHLTKMSVRTQKVYSDKVFAQSKDLQEITVVASVNYHVAPDMAADLYQKVGLQYPATVIQPALFQRTKAAIGQIRAEDFALSRSGLAETIQAGLTQQLSPYGIEVEFINIEDAIFDPAFVKAVKDKVIAEQKAAEQVRLIAAEAAIKQQTIIQAQARARSVQIEAKAQAKANILLAHSLTAELLRWRWIVTWNGNLPSTLVAGGKAALLLNGGYGGTFP